MSHSIPNALRVLLPLALLGCGTTGNRPVGAGPATTASPVSVSQAPPADPAAAASEGQTGRGVVALVAGQPLYVSELFEAWLHKDSRNVLRLIEELVLSRLVLAEARRLDIVLSDESHAEALAGVHEHMQQEVDRNGAGLSMEDFIRQRLGLDPTRYLERLEQQTRVDLLAERVVRAWLLDSERAEVSVIVVDRREDVDIVQAKLAQGEDFGKLAGEYSVEDSAARAGRIPPVVRGPAALARLAFSTPVGEVGGPVFESGQWLFLMVDGRPKPLRGSWSEVGQAVQASLAERPIEDPEYWQWKAAMLDRYEVDMEPFLDLVGEAVSQ